MPKPKVLRGDFLFGLLDEQTIVDGKTEYPTLLRLLVGKKEALKLAARLVSWAAVDDEEKAEFGLFGAMRKLPPD